MESHRDGGSNPRTTERTIEGEMCSVSLCRGRWRSGGAKAVTRAEPMTSMSSRQTVLMGGRHRGGTGSGGRTPELASGGASAASHSLPKARHDFRCERETKMQRKSRSNRGLRRLRMQRERRKHIDTREREVKIITEVKTTIQTASLTSGHAQAREAGICRTPLSNRRGKILHTRVSLHGIYRDDHATINNFP